MNVGVPKEIKDHEFRVALTPAGVNELTLKGHRVLVEKKAGEGSGFTDEAYTKYGAVIVNTAKDVYSNADLIIKVKEPLTSEYELLQEKQILFTYLHLAAVPTLLDTLLKKNVTAVAYETIERNGTLPLLTPMSEIAGRMSVLIGAQYMQKLSGGNGTLISSVPGVPKAKVVILGGGTVGTNAAKIALGLGAKVVMLDLSLPRLRQLDDIFNGQVSTVYSNKFSIYDEVCEADLVIGAVLVAGDRAPCLVTKEYLMDMKKGSLIVDVAVDQGGCVETIRATTHSNPVYFVDGILHYGVANMPGAVPQTSTLALTNATLPYLLNIADNGIEEAMSRDEGFLKGLNTCQGKVTHPVVANCLEQIYTPPGNIYREAS